VVTRAGQSTNPKSACSTPNETYRALGDKRYNSAVVNSGKVTLAKYLQDLFGFTVSVCYCLVVAICDPVTMYSLELRERIIAWKYELDMPICVIAQLANRCEKTVKKCT
jgi:hypothetical protein